MEGLTVEERLLLAWYAWWCKKRFGGMNGDLTGALIEGTELAALAAAVVWLAVQAG